MATAPAVADKDVVTSDDVAALARGLVREYLARKGMKDALATFDKEAVSGVLPGAAVLPCACG